ncbi:MAG: hypothetical protein ACOYL6_14815 [Bacteriovoracaceae bacterium]
MKNAKLNHSQYSMKRTVVCLQLLMLVVLLSACSAKQGTTDASIKIFRGTAQMSVNYATGGLVLFGANDRGDHFSRVVNPNNGTIELNLRNGTWVFNSLAWDHANFNFEGAIRCAISQPQQLTGGNIDLNLNLTNTNCNNSPFKGPSSMNGSTTKSFANFFPVNCQTAALGAKGLSNTSAKAVCSDSQTTNARGHLGSYKVVVDSYDFINGVKNYVGGTLTSKCLFVDPSGSKTTGVANKSTASSTIDLNIPPGNGSIALPFKIVGYYGNENCDATAGTERGTKVFSFPRGFAAGEHSAEYNTSLNGTINEQLVFLKTSDIEVCSGTERLTAAPFAAGSGTKIHPNVICTPSQFNNISSTHLSDSFRLAKDLDFQNGSFEPIGGTLAVHATSPAALTGHFYGNNHTISNITHKIATGHSIYGLIRKVGSSVIVNNLTLNNVRFIGDQASADFVGTLIGKLSATSISVIENIFIIDSEARGKDNVGLVAGYITGAQIVNVHATGSANGVSNVGGLIGQISSTPNSSIDTASFQGKVNAQNTDAGGILGVANSSVSMTKMRSAGTVTGNRSVGGLVGHLNLAGSAITLSYSLASVKGLASTGTYVGGLVGQSIASTSVTSSFQTQGTLSAKDGNQGGIFGFANSSSCSNSYYTGRDNSQANSCFQKTLPQLRINSNLSGGIGLIANSLPSNNDWFNANNNYDYPQLMWEKEYENKKLPHLKRQCSGLFATQSGSGTSTSPKSICNSAQFVAMTGNNFYILKGDIDLDDQPSFSATKITGPFNLDGDGHLVTNMKTSVSTCSATMGYIQSVGTSNYLKNVSFISPSYSVSGTCDAAVALGTVVGSNQGTIDNVLADGISLSMTASMSLGAMTFSQKIGGLVGINSGSGSIIKNSRAFGELKLASSISSAIDDTIYLGGLAAYNGTGAIIEKSISGVHQNREGTSGYHGSTLVGGIAAKNEGTIREVKSMGSFNLVPNSGTPSTYYIGGITGYNSGTVSDVFVSSNFQMNSSSSNPSKVGGLVGHNAIGGSIKRGIYQQMGANTNSFFSTTNKGAILGSHDNNASDNYEDLYCAEFSSSGNHFSTTTGLSGVTNGTISNVVSSCHTTTVTKTASNGAATFTDGTTSFTTSANWPIEDNYDDAIYYQRKWFYPSGDPEFLKMTSLDKF